MRSAKVRSKAELAPRSVRNSWRNSSYSCWLSPGITICLLVRPCWTPLNRVLLVSCGPVECCALARLAIILAAVMGVLPSLPNMKAHEFGGGWRKLLILLETKAVNDASAVRGQRLTRRGARQLLNVPSACICVSPTHTDQYEHAPRGMNMRHVARYSAG